MKEAKFDLELSLMGLAPNRAEDVADGFPCDPKTDWDAEEKEDEATGPELSPRTPKPELAPVAPGAGIPNNPVEV